VVSKNNSPKAQDDFETQYNNLKKRKPNKIWGIVTFYKDNLRLEVWVMISGHLRCHPLSWGPWVLSYVTIYFSGTLVRLIHLFMNPNYSKLNALYFSALCWLLLYLQRIIIISKDLLSHHCGKCFICTSHLILRTTH
jgi:hypothetical protein